MRRLGLCIGFLLALALPGGVAAAPPPAGAPVSWAQPEIETVVAAGLMAPSAAEFRPDAALTKAELAELLTALGGSGPALISEPAQPVTLAELDAALVRLLGLGEDAKRFRTALVSAGLDPPKRAGTEIVARLLGLRTNHPEAEDALELLPGDPVSRAETAYSVARVLALRGDSAWALEDVRAKAAAFALPPLTEWQRRVLTTAIAFVGYPYVWAGTSENEQAPLGKLTSGGFDCSGFVWRVYKLEPYPEAPQLADVLKGRTTYAMSGEVGPELRIPLEQLAPGDVVFFGDKGPESKPAQVGHMGISLGNGWFVHSSGRGVTVWPLEGWYLERFAWARRPLAEAGLS
jgi:cell wall-associated NlpC family hydrolase